MDFYVIKTDKTERLYEIAYDETDSMFHLVNLSDDYVRYQPFKTKEDILKGLQHFKDIGIITDYYKTDYEK